MYNLKLGIDFDGTIVRHEYPLIGMPNPMALEYLKQFKQAGAQLILWTMRSGPALQEAVDYCTSNGVNFDAVNEGIGDRAWTDSPKAHCNIYIDDAAFGCPLKPNTNPNYRSMVDWDIVGPKVLNILTP
jgi:hypothetical protein